MTEQPVGLWCPGCGNWARMSLSEWAFCGNEECPVFMWDSTKSLVENLNNMGTIDITPNPEEKKD